MRGVINPENHRIRPRFVGSVDMEGFLIRGRDVILPGWRWLNELLVGVSIPCRAVSTRWTAAFVPGSLEL